MGITEERTATIIMRTFEEQGMPQYTGISYGWLCQYVDEHCDKSQLAEFMRRKIRKAPDREVSE